MIMGLSISTIVTIIVAAIVLLIVINLLSGLLRLGIAIAVLAFAGYWIMHFIK